MDPVMLDDLEEGRRPLAGRFGGASVVLSDVPAHYRALIDPEISAATTPEIEVDGNGSAGAALAPDLIRVVVNPGSDATAAARLKAGYPECRWLRINNEIEIKSDTPITDVYLIALDLDTTAPANYTGCAYIISRDDADDADWEANMAHFVFDSGDNVRSIKIEATAIFATRFCRIKVQGASYG